MSEKIILFADNAIDFLETRAEFLEKEGYQLLLVTSPDEAERLLQESRIHLALLDVRLVNDDDEKDISGLEIALNHAYRSITKIILTGYGGVESARRVLRQQLTGFAPAVNYLEKAEGPEVLIQAINEAFDEYVKINWILAVDWKTYEAFSLVKQIMPNLERERLLNRADEYEDLFRRLFYEEDHIRVEQLLWQRDGRVALVVFAFKEGMKPESFVVVCGNNESVNNEAAYFNQYAPITSSGSATVLSENMRSETIHFSANAYSLVSNDLETIQSLWDLYRVGPEKTFNAAMDTLYRETLKAWHQDKLIRNRGSAKIVLYSERLHLANIDLQEVEIWVREIESRIPTLEASSIRTTEKLLIHFKNQAFEHSNPIPVLSKLVSTERQDMFITVPGFLSGENILTDSTGRIWLTDFADAGLAPVLWNYTSMEALIRYDWVDTKDLQRRYELEQCLVQTDFFKPEIRDIEPSVRKPARAIQLIRKLAARTVGKDMLSYHQGMFFHAASRLMEFDPSKPVTNTGLARFGHILLSMAMLADLLKESKTDSTESVIAQEERIQMFDETARILLVGRRKAHLAPQPFALFKYLYEKPNQLCTKGELLEKVFQNKYDEGYLHTLIGRIRKAIEVDPEHPRFLFTVQNAGYKLISKSE